MNDFEVVAAVSQAALMSPEMARSYLMHRVKTKGWDVLAESMVTVIASRTGVPVDELRIGVEIDLGCDDE